MSEETRSPADAFAITERPQPVVGWPADAVVDHTGVLERDIRDLMRRLAEARFATSECSRKQVEETRRLLLALLDIMDAFDRVFHEITLKKDQVTRLMNIWVGNFRAVRRLLKALLADHGVNEFETAGHEFDPHWHMVGETVSGAGEPDGTILAQIEPGYVWRGELLRKARVLVVSTDNRSRGQAP